MTDSDRRTWRVKLSGVEVSMIVRALRLAAEDGSLFCSDEQTAREEVACYSRIKSRLEQLCA